MVQWYTRAHESWSRVCVCVCVCVISFLPHNAPFSVVRGRETDIFWCVHSCMRTNLQSQTKKPRISAWNEIPKGNFVSVVTFQCIILFHSAVKIFGVPGIGFSGLWLQPARILGITSHKAVTKIVKSCFPRTIMIWFTQNTLRRHKHYIPTYIPTYLRTYLLT